MSERKQNNTRGFKISQYVFATIMGLVAVKLSPSHDYIPESANFFNIPSQLPNNFTLWWSVDSQGFEFYKQERELLDFPWVDYQKNEENQWHKLTHDHFRCKGCGARAPLALENGEYLFDCWGFDHGLVWINSKESVEPLLITLLNKLQAHLQTSVVIASGHRCPAHHKFITKGQGSPTDRHLIAAAADFYVKNYEESPQIILDNLQHIFNELAHSSKTKFQNIEPHLWKNGFCELRWHPKGSVQSPDHPEDIGFFELTLFQRLDSSPIRFIVKEAHHLPLF